MNLTRAAIIRAIRTAAQVASSGIGTAVLVEQVPWSVVASMTALSAIGSLLTSVATGLPEDED